MLGFTPASLVMGLLVTSLHGSSKSGAGSVESFNVYVDFMLMLRIRVLAADCGSVNIRSVAEADILRQNCPVVTGDITMGPFSDNTVTQHINLDGIEVIEGYIWEDYSSSNSLSPSYSRIDPYYTLSSSSLKAIGGVVMGSSPAKLLTLSFPNLTTVDDDFEVGVYSETLNYLNITKLDSVQNIHLAAPNLTTLHHNGLRNATHLTLLSMKLKSLDSFLDKPLNLTRVSVWGEHPNLHNISLGFKSAEFIGVTSDVSVILKGPSTGEMTIGKLEISGGTTDLKRSPQLRSLEVDELNLSGSIAITHLYLAFDNLRSLVVKRRGAARYMKKIVNPPPPSPNAVNWTGGFNVMISGTDDLNMTSMYDTDDQGHRIQTWYWPTNVSSLYISEVNAGNPFFGTFVSQQMAPLDSIPAPSVLGDFYIAPSCNTTNFTCAPFTKLIDMGRLPDNTGIRSCYNSTDINGAISLRVPSLPILISALLGAGMWAL